MTVSGLERGPGGWASCQPEVQGLVTDIQLMPKLCRGFLADQEISN